MNSSTAPAPAALGAGQASPRAAHPAAVRQVLDARSFAAGEPRIVLVRAEPHWNGPEYLVLSRGRTARVVTAVSPLAVLDALDAWQDSDVADTEVLAVLTDVEEAVLGPGVLARVYRNCVHPIEPWAVVRRLFGARDLDPRLTAESWAAEALIDAAGQEDWPKITGTVLSRDTALSRLAAARLSVAHHRLDPDNLDVHALLAWSLTPGAGARLTALHDQESQGVTTWLADPDRVGMRGHQALTALFALFAAGNGTDAVPVGLLCAALWSPAAPAGADRARGRAELKFGSQRIDDDSLAAFGAEAEAFMRTLMTARSVRTAEDVSATDGPDPRALMARADMLTREVGAEEAAAASDLLEAGQNVRYRAVARALTRCVPRDAKSTSNSDRLTDLAEATERLERHEFFRLASHRDSLIRLRMAQRLVTWLTRPLPDEPTTTAEAIQRHIRDSAWVDLALGWVSDGDHAHPELPAALASVSAAVRRRRHTIDEQFAQVLAEETRAGGTPRDALAVEDFARRVLAPVIKRSRPSRPAGPPLLFLLLDGASAAVAAGLAEQLRARSWAEYDPVTDTDEPEHRRGMLAALPTLTKVSRGSLFAGELTEIDQQEERRRFTSHRFWGGATVQLFHKADLRGEDGHALGSELTEALADPDAHVGVVINTIDDRLGEDRAMSHWWLDELLGMEELLSLARAGGRALVLTSDHGHVLDHDTHKTEMPDALSARHRSGTKPAGEGEIVLSGRRVVAAGNRVTALWDTTARYGNRQAGYHGGASLAEVAIPVLAFAPYGATLPKGWRELGPQQPDWWSLQEASVPGSSPAPQPRSGRRGAVGGEAPASLPSRRPEARRAPRKEEHGQGALVSLDDVVVDGTGEQPPTPEPTPPSPDNSPAQALVGELRASPIMQAQIDSLPRKETFDTIAAALRALVEAHGILPVTTVAEQAGKRTSRASGFAATLQRALNYDQAEVLTLTDNGRSLRLDLPLLRRQFGLDKAGGTRS
ncbi:BREX-2 system phosphatase PglZ [Streptomyces sp. WMMB303]|uniref:BREX-2 system phosphatase PglZ n=1 Tax=Streptomyces sp. WMMB303 TaxID=3034154 RepID=UPI0023EDFCCD|nr:BREX-2 system phosphatase PglZ [Streptomyces sp. WMMB303]MDF4251125.1 BREX-2 system phosphatase PglZ [Streptomyces sp. WMMB303]